MNPEEAFSIVRRARVSGRMAPVFLVVGSPRAEGGALARRIAALLLCEREPAEAPCGQCPGCRRVADGSHPDVLSVEPQGRSRQLPIWLFRPDDTHPPGSRVFFLDWAQHKSFYGGWKIGILHFADRLNSTTANVLLKTLEEPPEDTSFILVSDRPDELLPTVVSRCQILNLMPGHSRPAEPWRTRTAQILAKHSHRSATRAFATAARFAALFAEITAVAESKVKAEQDELYAASDSSTLKKVDDKEYEAMIKAAEKEIRIEVYRAMQDWYRDILMLCAAPGGAADAILHFPEFRAELARRAAATPLRVALRLPEFVQDIRYRIEERNLNAYAFVFAHWLSWMP